MAFVVDLVAIKLRGGKYEVIDQLRDPVVTINPIQNPEQFLDISDNTGYLDAVAMDRVENFDRFLMKKDGALVDNRTNQWFKDLSPDAWAVMMSFSECEGEAIYAQ